MEKNNTEVSGGISFMGLLAIVFITLKLCNVITWSWWLVTLPLWGGLAMFLLVCIAVIIAYCMGKLIFKRIK